MLIPFVDTEFRTWVLKPNRHNGIKSWFVKEVGRNGVSQFRTQDLYSHIEQVQKWLNEQNPLLRYTEYFETRV